MLLGAAGHHTYAYYGVARLMWNLRLQWPVSKLGCDMGFAQVWIASRPWVFASPFALTQMWGCVVVRACPDRLHLLGCRPTT